MGSLTSYLYFIKKKTNIFAGFILTCAEVKITPNVESQLGLISKSVPIQTPFFTQLSFSLVR